MMISPQMQQTIMARPESLQTTTHETRNSGTGPLAPGSSSQQIKPVLRVMILITGAVLWSLVLPRSAVAQKESIEIDFTDNIGFIHDIPTKIRKELPLCNRFLDVKWIKKMPPGNWVGRVVVDVKNNGKKEKRELAVVEEYKKRHHGRFEIFDITATEYRQSEFDRLILSADRALNLFPSKDGCLLERGLFIAVKGKGVVVSKEWRGAQKYLDRGVTSPFTRNSTGNICIVHPEKKRWLFKKK